MRRFLAAVAALAVLGGIVWFAWGGISSLLHGSSTTPPAPKPLPPPPSYETKPEEGYLAPNFELKTIDGADVRLGDYLGRVVIVVYWASWCPFCRQELSNLAHLGATTPHDVVILAINRGETTDVIRNYINQSTPPPANMLFLTDPGDTSYPLYLGMSMPQSFYLDRDGVIRSIARRELSYSEMRAAADPLIAAPAACQGKVYGQNC